MFLFGPPDVDRLKAKGDVKGLIKALGYERDRRIGAAAARALGQVGDARAVEPLIATLKDSDRDVRCAAGEALGRARDARAVQPLIAALEDPYVRWTAAKALGEVGDARAVGPLAASLKDKNADVCQAASDSLGQIAAPAVEPLIAVLKDSPRSVRQIAAEALDKIGWRPDRGQAGAAYWAAKQQWDECIATGTPAVEPLTVALKDKDADVRWAASEALGKIWDARGVGPLIDALTDVQWHVRESAAAALVKMYASGRLSGMDKQRILAQRGTITVGHYDGPRHVDYGPNCHVDERPHEDNGIGVDFPV
jgi:HEAT repeat protein